MEKRLGPSVQMKNSVIGGSRSRKHKVKSGAYCRASGCFEGAAQRSLGRSNGQSHSLFWPCSARSRYGDAGPLSLHRLVVVLSGFTLAWQVLLCFS